MTTGEDRRPTPTQIDDLCLAFDTAKAEASAAQEKVDQAKDALLPVVRTHGAVPSGAEKTMRLEGLLYVADSTVSTKTEINEAAVVALMFELMRSRKSKVFHDLFEPITKHVLRKGAAEHLRLAIAAMPQSRQNVILGKFALCFDAKSTSPTLSVDLVESIKRKEAETAEKAAKKAAKKGERK